MGRCSNCYASYTGNQKYCIRCGEEISKNFVRFFCNNCKTEIKIEYDIGPIPKLGEDILHCPKCGSDGMVDWDTHSIETHPDFPGWKEVHCGQGVIKKVPDVERMKQIERNRRQAEEREIKNRRIAEWKAREKAKHERIMREAADRKKRVASGKGSFFDNLLEL